MPVIKVLVDNSCVLAALDHDLMPFVSGQLPKKGPACEYWTTQYLRMEFFRRWIITGIELYFCARRIGSLKEALAHFSHRFGRQPKIILMLVANCWERALKDPPEDHVEYWGWQVYSLACLYDKLFNRHVTPPVTGCRRGETRLDLDAPVVRKALQDFYDRFTAGQHDCKVRSLLANPVISSMLHEIFGADVKGFSADARRAFKDAKRKYTKLAAAIDCATCRTCSSIGDVLIAIEQPSWGTLYHSDHVFDLLCALLNKPHHKVQMPPQSR